MDSYLSAIAFPLTTSTLIYAPLAYLLVPEFSSQQIKWQISGVSTYLVRSLNPYLCLISILGFFFQNGIVGFSLNRYLMASAMAWIMLPINISLLIFTSAVQVKGGFYHIGLANVFPSLTSFLFCLFAVGKTGIEWALVGQLSGAVIVLIHLMNSQSTDPIIAKDIRVRILANLPKGFLATLIFSVYPISDAYWGKMVGVSTTSHLAYAQKIIVSLSGVIVAAANMIAYQQIADFASEGKDNETRKYLIKKIITVVDFVFPMSIIVGATAKTLGLIAIQKLNTGRFNAQDVIALADMLRPMLAGMVFMSTMGFLFKCMVAEKKNSQAAVISVGGSVLYFMLSGFFQRFSGATGIGYAYMVTWIVVFIVSVIYLFTYNLIQSILRDVSSELTKSLIRNILAALVSYGLLIFFTMLSKKTGVSRTIVVIFKIASITFAFLLIRLVSLSNAIAFLRLGFKKS